MQPYEKDFLSWHTEKSRIQNSTYKPFFKEKEIWWCSIGLNIGHEEDGKGINFRRPILVLRKLSEDTFFGVPLSSKLKLGSYFYNFSYSDQHNTALLAQLRMSDSGRLDRILGVVSEKDFDNIKKAVKNLF